MSLLAESGGNNIISALRLVDLTNTGLSRKPVILQLMIFLFMPSPNVVQNQ